MSIIDKPFQLLRSGPRRRWVWLGFPLVLYLWTLPGPFMFDDLIFVLKGERYERGEADCLDLFRFITSDEQGLAARDRGTLPWWATEAQRVDFFRPLSEWIFYLDLKLFGRHAVGHRIMSLAWFAVAVLCLHRLYATACGDATRAGVATLLFGASQTVTAPATWICNRCDLLVVVGTALAANAYWSACRRARRRHVAVAAAGFALALLSKESALVLAGVICLHEVVALVRRRSLGGGRVRALIPVVLAVMSAAYIALYLHNRPWLLDATGESGGALSMLSRFPKALPIFLSVWTLGYPISVLLQAPAWHVNTVVVLSIAATLILIRYLRRFIVADRAAPFFLTWTLLYVGLALLTITDTRALCPATVGWAYLLAGLLTPAADRPGFSTTPNWLRVWLLTTNGVLSIWCGIAFVVVVSGFEKDAKQCIERYVAAQDPPIRDGDVLIVAEAPHPLHLASAGDRLEYLTGLRNVAFSYLAVDGSELSFKREDEHTFLLTSPASLFSSPAHRLALGPDWRPALGCKFELTNFTARIAAVEGDSVRALQFRFTDPLASSRLHFYPPRLQAVARGRADPAAFHIPPVDTTGDDDQS